MQLSPLINRLGGSDDAWSLHFAALEAKAGGRDVIVLTIGDPDLDTPSAVTEACVSALRNGDTHYTQSAGRPALRAAVASLHQRTSGMPTAPGEVVICSGAQGALFSACMALFAHGDEVLVPDPVYVTYEATLRAAGAEPVAVATSARSLRIDPSALRAAATGRTRGLLLANPCNPIGYVMRPDELADIAKIAVELDLWVISDEVYSSLTYGAPHICMASRPGMARRTVTLGSLSKSHAMTGWRCGWAVAPEKAAEGMAALAECMSHGLPSFIQAGALEAFRLHEECAAYTLSVFRRRRDLMVGLLSAIPGIVPFTPEAGMFVLADVRGTGIGSAEFSRDLFAETGVALLDAAVFGRSTAGCVRLSLAVPDGEITAACRRIERFSATRIPVAA